jgi:hypothetical protein
METIKTKSGVIVKGTYGSAYDAGSDTVKEARIKSGKRGRPVTVNVEPVAFITNPMNDLFGRVPTTVPHNNIVGKVIIGKASVNAVYANDEE